MILTDRDFWLKYWKNKEDLIFTIKKRFILFDEIAKIVETHKPKNAIELGGFPGYFAVYLKKWYKVNSTLLDFIILPEITKKLCLENGLSEDDVNLIEADLWGFEPEQKFDLVMSVGLIEHFENTQDILKQHIKFLEEGGLLFVNIPNFRGFNGWLQKVFDVEHYNKHYLPSMDPVFLAKELEGLGLKEVKSYYYGGFSMWLEKFQDRPLLFRILFKLIWFILKSLSKLIPFESKWFSPYINLQGVK